jgi:glutaconate CoA-transferase subunit B
VITDLGVLRPDPESHELTLSSVHPGVSVDRIRAETQWDLRVAPVITITDSPTTEELETLRALKRRSAEAYQI